MKLKVEKSLPIVLAIFLPALNLFSNRNIQVNTSLDFYTKWMYASLVLFVLWYVLDGVTRIKSKYLIGYVITSIIATISVVYLLFVLGFIDVNESEIWVFLIKMVSASILFLVIQYALKANQSLMHLKLKEEKLQTENYKVQLEALRAKIDPHFLFNSLNTLRSMVRQQEPKSEQFVLSLSDFYRETLRFNDASVLKLYEEIKVLESYLFLMKNRNESALQLNINITKKYFEHQIPTLALQSIIENCFKHNLMTSKQPLKIEVKSLSDLRISISNNVQLKLSSQVQTGLGLSNLKKRYELLGVNNGVEVLQNEKVFTVKLKLL
ncbi:sensor histidine kinase [Cyclobacterium marinum]|uniref:Putative signal transduction histidine kinase n=1 Tax=Cyclobacterium marinum (strain ATCC 25205 / DSM 745 / LMG 13164 / NCIMB 1802) TaxID=880070 RepID=G0IV05_CYCMS|nr:histidine kinase [Cyclobacterium marinum]AEL26229.1 putative signal transduction histidine kinase [Cyclobacterium marinum DSM 745]